MGICGFLKKEYFKNLDFGFVLFFEFYGWGFVFEVCCFVFDYGVSKFVFWEFDVVIDLENECLIRLFERLKFF